MRKISVFLMTFIILITMSACDGVTGDSGTKTCIPGWELIDGDCVEVVPECNSNQVLVNNVCVDNNNDATYEGPEYTSQGYDYYSGRDLVNDDCSHLDNIGEWQPVWCDEFDYVGLPDSSLWNYDVGGHGWGNGESQYYTNADQDNAFVKDGILTIRSIKEYVSGKDYTSTRLISKDKGDFLYGKIQVRAKVPAGTGTWPAIWMLPTNWEYGGWPTSGEIDIMEYVGYQPNVVHATVHTGAFNHMLNTQVGKARSLATIEEEFHVYEIEWEPNVIRFYLNGIEYFKVSYDVDTMNHVLPHEAWPFDKEFHLLLNTAIGGAWGGVNGIDDSIFPVDFQIDYVRVYQKDYVGMDEENPDQVENLRAISLRQNSIFLGWDVAVDDVMVEKYEVYQDDILVKTVTHNGILMDDLDTDTSYDFKVVAVDFAGNKGVPATLTVSTKGPSVAGERIEAEDYDDMSGVQLETTSDTGGGMNVGWIDNGDFLEYTITIEESGNYVMQTRAASQSGSGGFDLVQDGTFIFRQGIPSTGGWQNWQTLTSESFYLEAGTYTFKLDSKDGGYNLNYFSLVKQN